MHILFYKLTSNSSNKKFYFLPVQSGPGGLQDLNLEADLNFLFRCVNNTQKDAYDILFYKLTSNSSNKKFNFLPVQIRPGGLQDLNLEADFHFFFWYVINIHKDAYFVL